MRILFFLLVCFSLQGQGVVDRFTRFASAGDPILALSPDIYVNSGSIVSADQNEGTAITEWSNVANATPDGSPGVSPEIHVGTSGSAVQCSCIAANDDWLNFGTTYQYDPSSDKSAWFVILFGDFISGSSNSVLSQAVSTAGDSAFDIGLSSANIYVRLGGDLNISSYNPGSNELIIVNVGSSSYDVWADGTKIIDGSTAIGTANDAANINLCARNDGDLNTTSDIDLMALKFGETLTQQQIDDIEAAFQVN